MTAKTRSTAPEWLKSIGMALTPIMVIYVGSAFTSAQKDRETSLRYVEIAISILREKPSEQQASLRKWAVNVLAKHSTVALDEKAKTELELTPLLFFPFRHSNDPQALFRKAPYIQEEPGRIIIEFRRNKPTELEPGNK